MGFCWLWDNVIVLMKGESGARRMTARSWLKANNHVSCVANHVRPKLRQHSVRDTALANTVFNTVIPPIK